MVAMEAMEMVAEFVFRVVLVLGVTGVVVWAMAAWMQNNPTMQARRATQSREAMRVQIATETRKKKF